MDFKELQKDNPKKCITELYSLLSEDFSKGYKELRGIYDVSNKAFMKYFIKSDILFSCFEKIYADYIELKKRNKNPKGGFFLENVIKDYFNQRKYINTEFIRILKIKDKNLLFKYIYSNKVYEKTEHIQSFSLIFNKNDKFIKLLIFLNKIYTQLLSQKRQVELYLKNYTFTELLLEVQYLINKESTISTDDVIMDSVIPKILDIIASDILNYKIELDNKKYSITVENFIIEMVDIVKNKAQKFNLKKENKIKTIFRYFSEFNNYNEVIDNLKYNHFNYEFIDSKTIKLFPKSEMDYLEYKKSGEKEKFKEKVLHNYINNKFNTSDMETLNKKTRENMNRSLYKIVEQFEESIYFNNKDIKFDIIVFALSKLSERCERIFEQSLNKALEYSTYPKALEETVYHNIFQKRNSWSFINIRNKAELVKATTGEIELKMERKEDSETAISIFDFFSSDINNGEKIDLVKKPFIKVNDNYIWGHSSLRYKDIHYITSMNIFSNPQLENIYIKKISTDFEKLICNIFSKNGYVAVDGLYPKENHSKDLDVLAYKNGILYIVETKITYYRHTYSQIMLHTELKFNEAKSQLLDRVKNIDKYLENINIGEIKKIIPLIVTNSFEGNPIQGNGIFKLSDKELIFYLENNSEEELSDYIKNDLYWKSLELETPVLKDYPIKIKEFTVIHKI